MNLKSPKIKPKKLRLSLRFIAISFLVTGAVITLLLFSTTPSDLGPQGVTGFFLAFYLFVLTITEFIYKTIISKRKYWPFWMRAFYSAMPVMILALSSLSQLTSVDIIVGVFLIIAVTVYHNQRSDAQ